RRFWTAKFDSERGSAMLRCGSFTTSIGRSWVRATKKLALGSERSSSASAMPRLRPRSCSKFEKASTCESLPLLPSSRPIRSSHETAADGDPSGAVFHPADAARRLACDDGDRAGCVSKSLVDRAGPARAHARMVHHTRGGGAGTGWADALARLFYFLAGAGRAA